MGDQTYKQKQYLLSKEHTLKVVPGGDVENFCSEDLYACIALAWDTNGAQNETWAGLNSFSLNDFHFVRKRNNDDAIEIIQNPNMTCKTGM